MLTLFVASAAEAVFCTLSEGGSLEIGSTALHRGPTVRDGYRFVHISCLIDSFVVFQLCHTVSLQYCSMRRRVQSLVRTSATDGS
jgi:hypothetical protein